MGCQHRISILASKVSNYATVFLKVQPEVRVLPKREESIVSQNLVHARAILDDPEPNCSLRRDCQTAESTFTAIKPRLRQPKDVTLITDISCGATLERYFRVVVLLLAL